MISKTDILTYLSTQKEELFKEYQLEKLALFGSFARGEETEGSDIDILVEFQPNTQQLSEKKMALKTIIKNRFNREVDICREKYIKPYFKPQILQSAIYV